MKKNCGAIFDGGVILLHGGGNFGDIWPDYQKFRERIILRQMKGSVTLLRQPINFSEETALDRTAAILKHVPNVRLLVRGVESYDVTFARFGCEVALGPDMAFAIGPLERTALPYIDVLLLQGTDKGSGVMAPVTGLLKGWEQADRLHLRIISTLMGVPHCFLDNNYGNVLRISKGFNRRWNGSYYSTSVAEAITIANKWLADKSTL